MPILDSIPEKTATRRIVVAIALGAIFGLQSWCLAKYIPLALGARPVGLKWVLPYLLVMVPALVAGFLIALVLDVLFPPARKAITGRPFVPQGAGRIEHCPANAIRRRLAEAKASLDSLDVKQERRGDSGFARAAGNRIVWRELLDLELQDVDEQLSHICDAAGDGRTKTRAKEFLMNATTHEPLNLNDEERALLDELLESAGTKLLVEIRRTDHRAYRDELRHRLTLVEAVRERCRPPSRS